MSEHARLSPSSAARWISCPRSVRLIESLPTEERDEESVYAREGTLAHELGELRAGLHFGIMSDADFLHLHGQWEAKVDADFPAGTTDEMEAHIAGYVDLLEQLKGDDGVVFLEQRMPTGVPESWGTSDAVIVHSDSINIVDLKYGAGVPVSAVRNPQLRLYALGALDEYDGLIGDAQRVTATVFQPRVNNTSHETLTVEEILLWRSEVAIPAAVKALYEPYAHFGPSDDACRWCPLAGVCRARTEWATRRDFGDITGEAEPDPTDPVTLTPVEIGRVLPRVKRVTSWAKDVEAAALDLAYSQGQDIPGYKVVRSGGQRKITDDTAAIQHMIDLGFTAEQVADFKIKGFGALEKALGKDTVADALGDFIVKGPGREALVPETDRRPAISPHSTAVEDFS